MNPYDVINHLTVSKTPWDELDPIKRNTISMFIVNRSLAMNDDYVELIDDLQDATVRMPLKQAYNLYLDILPKRRITSRYVKAEKDIYPQELIQLLSKYFELGANDVKRHLSMMDKSEVESILRLHNMKPKEIKQMMKGW